MTQSANVCHMNFCDFYAREGQLTLHRPTTHVVKMACPAPISSQSF